MIRVGLLALLAVACAGSQRRGVLFVRADVPDAAVYVDERYLGELRDLAGGLSLRPGVHHIELRHENYHPRYAEVELSPGEREVLDLTLAEILP